MVRTSFCAVAAVLFSGFVCAAQTPGASKITIQRNVPVTMRDGVVLRADIFRPAAEGKFPVLLQRTPYNKSGGSDEGYQGAQRGYVVIIQDTRGRYASGGDWTPFVNESRDGYDTVEWAAALPYSDGKVGMFGGSYVGATQMLTAITTPPHLAGICPLVTASNYHENWTYQGGAFEQWFNESWTSGLAQDTLTRRAAANSNALLYASKLPLTSYPLFETGVPASPEGAGVLAPYFLDWLAHPSYDAYWKRVSIEENYGKITVPVFNIGGWYDIFLGGTLRNYMGIRDHGGSEAARKGQRLMIIPGGHAGMGRKIGDVDLGAHAPFNETETMLDWYDYLFKGIHNHMASEKPVKIFVLGKNDWREEADWPPPEAKTVHYYLESGGHANSLRGDGTLARTAANHAASDKFIYDPENPAPTRGGNLCCDSEHLEPGARDQRPVEAREDVLVYTTRPFEHAYDVTGPVSVELYASSSAVDTDFTAKLVDVAPDGFAQNLEDSIVRARYRDSREHAELLNPGQVYKFTIDLFGVSDVFQPGHRLRVEISSSDFPRFDRNLNTGEDQAHGTHFVKAANTIYHDTAHPSALILSVIPH